MDEIIVGVQVGNVILSFKTDEKGSNLKKGLATIREFAETHKALFKTITEEDSWRPVVRKDTSTRTPVRSGKAETSLILRRIEDKVLPRAFFKSARTTGDVKSELKTETGIDFTSRKVSQALGVLFKRGALSRVGSKGNFRYIQY